MADCAVQQIAELAALSPKWWLRSRAWKLQLLWTIVQKISTLFSTTSFTNHARVPYASSLPKDLVEQPQSDADGGAEVQAILRQTIDGACSGTSAQSKIPPSQQESEHADSMVAGSVARQIIAPHAAAGSNSRDVEEQVHSEAEGYVDAVEQAVAREFVASASNLQGVPQPSHEQLSQKTDSVVSESITRNPIVGGMYESDVRSQSGHIPEESLSDGLQWTVLPEKSLCQQPHRKYQHSLRPHPPTLNRKVQFPMLRSKQLQKVRPALRAVCKQLGIGQNQSLRMTNLGFPWLLFSWLQSRPML